MNYVIRDAAQEDIYEQYSFYFADRDSESLAQRFLAAIDVAIHEICRDPGIGSPRYETHSSLQGLRSWQVKGFPATRILLPCSTRRYSNSACSSWQTQCGHHADGNR